MSSEIVRGGYYISGDLYDSEISINYTPADKNNNLVLVDFACTPDSAGNDYACQTCTFGGTNMTNLGKLVVTDQGGRKRRHELYKMFFATPPGQKTLYLYFGYAQPVHIRVKIVDYYNVSPDQHRSVYSSSITHPNDTQNSLVYPTSEVGDKCVDFVNKYWQSQAPYTTMSGQSAVWSGHGEYGGHSTRNGLAGSSYTTMEWAVDWGEGGEWTHFGLALIPAPYVRGSIMVF